MHTAGTACLLPANNSGPDDPNGDTLIVGACLDEHMALLPSRKEGYYRRRSLYAATPCTIAALSSDKLTEIRRVRPGASFLEPMCEHGCGPVLPSSFQPPHAEPSRFCLLAQVSTTIWIRLWPRPLSARLCGRCEMSLTILTRPVKVRLCKRGQCCRRGYCGCCFES